MSREGKILSSGVVRAKEVAAALGLGGPDALKRPEAGTGRPKLTPAQQRARDEGKPLPPDPEGFKRTTISGGRDAWEFLGRPDVSTPPPGSPDGTPIKPDFVAREDEEAREQRPNVDWDRVDEQREAERIAREVEETERRVRALVKKEAEIEARRQRRRRR